MQRPPAGPRSSTTWIGRPRPGRWVAAAFVLAALVLVPRVDGVLRASALLLRLTAHTQTRLAHYREAPVLEQTVQLTTPSGPVRARLYRPAGQDRHRGLVLGHGVHHLGIDEPRLVAFARALAGAGVAVLTPALEALTDYRVDHSAVQTLSAAVRWMDGQAFREPGGVGIVGLSFAGGLGLLAAAEPDTRPHVNFALTVGGHHDLSRVMRFLATDRIETPEGEIHAPAHPYGMVLFAYAHADRFAAPGQVEPLRDVLRDVLHMDWPAVDRDTAHLDPDTAALVRAVRANDKSTVAPRLLAMVPEFESEMRALSPRGHVAALRGVPVWILHGVHDDVIPPSEARALEAELRPLTPTRLVLSEAMRHVNFEHTPSAREAIELVRLVGAMLAR